MKRLLWALVLVGSIALPSWAGEKTTPEWGGVIFADYNFTTTKGKESFNAFEIRRVYLTLKHKLSEKHLIQVTTDVGRALAGGFKDSDGNPTSGDPRFFEFLKVAYLESEYKKDHKMVFGLSGTTGFDLSEKFWEHRFVQQAMLDEEKRLTSADLGIHLKGKCVGQQVEYDLAVLNGEGHTKPEVNKYKSFQTRLTFNPKGVKGLTLSGMGFLGVKDKDTTRGTFTGFLGYDNPRFKAGYEVAFMNDDTGETVTGLGHSIIGIVKLQKGYKLFGRFNMWDPNTDTEKDGHSRLIVGISKKIHDKLTFAIDDQMKFYQADGKDTENTIFVHSELKF